MTDLQCAARVFVARHGEASYESELLSDSGGWLTRRGREQSRDLAARLGGERVAAVWSSPMSRAVQTAEIAAAGLGVDVVVREGLREFGVGHAAGTTGDPDPFAETFAAWLGGDLSARIPGAETGLEVLARYGAVLDEVADAHRGEAVLVVSHGGATCLALPVLARNLAPEHALDLPLGNCELVALEADADGWVARSWAGRTLD
ncbi:histidine phosphatase family protein [Nocardioides sp. zg-1228]|uniref:histidine phosphatase family protein n=1 Tax=Nocardioides sp. zg-1228 TaxID=2763008 RepID=UPI00164286D8|nr:histidine phosphatase family protein [Nocardioides sp. zg-1228]MBC2934096.1 histidine phosphatase family protein [Nocardioides sp. zg-1228]QSF58846.1 histidine phosphatase family protein [Nocardioides sp. zg-1228]